MHLLESQLHRIEPAMLTRFTDEQRARTRKGWDDDLHCA